MQIYAGMAGGVSHAACVVAFLTQRYEDSTYCAMELKFAKSQSVPIVPVLLQGGGWRPSGWLGLILAGVAWMSLNESRFEEGLQSLMRRLSATVQGLTITSGSADSVTVSPPRAPLTSEGLASLPAQVPHLIDSFQVTSEMERLKDLLLLPPESPGVDGDQDDEGEGERGRGRDARTQGDELRKLEVSSISPPTNVGAHGMGGVGKTTLASWVAHHPQIRRHFELILWVTVSETPNIQLLQQLIYLQSTGRPLSSRSAQVNAELIAIALRGKRALLILDDIWDEESVTALNHVDQTAQSRTLVTTRIKGLVRGAQRVEVGLPSEVEAAQMLLKSTMGYRRGADDRGAASSMPAAAAAVVKMCGRLPLALNIAGRLIADMGLNLEAEWHIVPAILRQQMAHGDKTSLTHRLIVVSLQTIPPQHKAGCLACLRVLAMLDEDMRVPPRPFRIVLSVLMGSDNVSELKMRQWIQLLISRSLIVNTWERPALHDIVREAMLAQMQIERLEKLVRMTTEDQADIEQLKMDWMLSQSSDEVQEWQRERLAQKIWSAVDLPLHCTIADKLAANPDPESELVELAIVKSILLVKDAKTFYKYRHRAMYLLQTHGNNMDPVKFFNMLWIEIVGQTCIPEMHIGSYARTVYNAGAALRNMAHGHAAAARSNLSRALTLAPIVHGLQCMVTGLSSSEDWEKLFGAGGSHVVAASRHYVLSGYDEYHLDILRAVNWDPAIGGGLGTALAVRWGNLVAADELWANNVTLYRRVVTNDPVAEGFCVANAFPGAVITMYLTGRGQQCAEWLEEFDWTWSNSHKIMSSLLPNMVFDRFYSTATWVWACKCSHALCAEDMRLSLEDLASVPNPVELERLSAAVLAEDVKDHTIVTMQVFTKIGRK
eukprot:COSAG01_NODE_4865_length_4672_cov_6.338071_2_plen_887_part_00